MTRKKKTEAPENNEVLAPTPMEEIVLEAVEGVLPAELPATEEVSKEASLPDVPSEEATLAQKCDDNTVSAPESAVPDEATEEDDGKTHVSLSLPLGPFKSNFGSIDRLKAAIHSKQTLLKKALATDNLEIQIEEDRVVFPWFTVQDESKNAEEVDAYTKLVFALAKKALTQARVSSEEKLNPDERLGMRLYLINLGFIGDEYKNARAILMRNFTGNSATQKFASEFNLAMPEVYVKKESRHE